MIVFLTEEASMTPVLKKVMQVIQPDSIEGYDWLIIAYRGNADLHKNLVRKMREWEYGDPHFVILRDNDGGDCHQLKKELLKSASQVNKPYHVRIVCQELEAWFIGDLDAVESAFPSSNATDQAGRANFRDPDILPDPNAVITKLTGTAAKVGRAEKISSFLNLEVNRSPSFKLLISTLKALSVS